MIEATTLAVILLIESAGDVTSSAVLDDVEAAVVWRPTLRLLRDAISPFARCGGDEACLGADLAELRIGLGLVVLINTDVGLVSVRAIESQSRAIRARRSGSFDAEGRALIGRLVREVLDELGHREAARLAIEGELEGLAIDPPPLGGNGNLFWVAPGRTRIKADGAAEVEVDARAGQQTAVALVRESTSIAESPWLWVGIAAVVIGAAVAAGLLASRDDDLCVCLGRPASACPEC